MPGPLLPTSIHFSPPFTLLHHLRGHGDSYRGGVDVSYHMNKWGTWQPDGALAFPPVIVEAFLDGLSPGVWGSLVALCPWCFKLFV